MGRGLTCSILILLVAALSAAAVEWEEIGGTATVVSDHDTGLPAVIFNAGLSYDEPPEMMQLRIQWEVFSVDGATQTMLYEYTKTTRLRSGATNIYSASQSVLIEVGQLYGARVSIEDLENGLSYTRSLTYVVPLSLSVGLRLIDWAGGEDADLTGLEDKELEELVLLQRYLASAEVLAEGVSLSSFFSQYAPTSAEYPVSVVLLPESGYDGNWGSDSQPITVTFGLAVLIYAIPSADAVSGFQQQIVPYDQTFTGTVYAGPGGDALSEGVIVFVHETMGVILNAAVAELAARSS
ncbi:hypothetical protein ACFLSW_05670 [Candidatus Bipolaricaulota bacterium]